MTLENCIVIITTMLFLCVLHVLDAHTLLLDTGYSLQRYQDIHMTAHHSYTCTHMHTHSQTLENTPSPRRRNLGRKGGGDIDPSRCPGFKPAGMTIPVLW